MNKGAYRGLAQPRALRYVPLPSIVTALSTTSSADIAQSHIASLGSTVPANAEGVSIIVIANPTTANNGARLNIYDYNEPDSANFRHQAMPGQSVDYNSSTCHWVGLGGDRQFDYQFTVSTGGSTQILIYVTGYWVFY